MIEFRPLLRSLLLAGGAVFALAACSPTIDQRGNLPTPDRLAQIKAGESTRDEVTQILGSPSVIPSFDKNTWLYVSSKTQNVAFLKTQIIDQEVLEIAFNEEGIVQDIRKLGLQDARNVAPVERTTPAPGHEMTVIEQLVGNFGRFNPLAGRGTSNAPGSGR